MARFRASLYSHRPPEELFAYLSDFSNAAEWDPGTETAWRVDNGPIGLGSQFHLVARFLGRQTPIDYRIIEYTPSRVVTLLGENHPVRSEDRITFEDFGDSQTRITYDAQMTLSGFWRVFDPALGLVLRRLGRGALDGLRRTLAARS